MESRSVNAVPNDLSADERDESHSPVEPEDIMDPHHCGCYAEYGFHDWDYITVGPYVVDEVCVHCEVTLSQLRNLQELE